MCNHPLVNDDGPWVVLSYETNKIELCPECWKTKREIELENLLEINRKMYEADFQKTKT